MITLDEAVIKYGGQIFGWIAMPDQRYLVNFIPEISEEFEKPMRVVEIGTFIGSTARGLASMTGGMLTSIDNWKDVHPGSGCHGFKNQEQAFWHVIKGPEHGKDLSKQVKLIVGDSREVGKTWSEPIDLLFIDGDHSYETSSSDMKLFSPHVVTNGYCLIDDCDMYNVKRAILENMQGNKWSVIRDSNEETAKLCVMKRTET